MLRCNFLKANWEQYSSVLDRSIVTIPSCGIAINEAYRRLQGAIFRAASTSIPRGRRPVYIPCMDEECQTLLQEYEDTGDPDITDHLIESLNAARCKRDGRKPRQTLTLLIQAESVRV